MKILKVYPHPDVKAGTEISMHLGSEALQQRGHQVFLLHGMTDSPQTAAGYQGELGLPLIFDRQSKLNPHGFSSALTQAMQFIRQHQIDIIHIHGYPRTTAIRQFAETAPTVASIHVPLCPNGSRYFWTDRAVCDRTVGFGCLTTGYQSKGCGHLGNGLPIALPGFLRAMWENSLLCDALKQCGNLITNSLWMKEKLVADSFPRETLHVVHEPIVVSEEISDQKPDDPPVIAFVGRLVNFKGPDHLLRASARISRSHQVWFIGAGAMRPSLEALTQELGLAKRVTFFGGLPPEEIAEYRRRSAIIVVPSLWPEPFGMVGPEAMLMRRPVVAYRVGGIPEWLQDRVTGYLVNPGDVSGLAQALETLLDDPGLASKMGIAGAKVAAQWKPEQHAASLLKIYQVTLNNSGSMFATSK